MNDLGRLRVFVAVAEELHFGRAADRLGLTQPQVSRQIAALESQLGVTLFDRDSRNVRITPAGQVLRERGGSLLELSDQIIDEVHAVAAGSQGTLRIGFVGSAGFRILPKLLQRFRAGHPDVRLVLQEMTTAEQVKALARREIDLGLMRPPVEAGLESAVIWRERLVAVVQDGHPLAGEPTIALSDLARENFVIFPRELGPGFHDRIITLCITAGFSPRIAQRAVQMPTIVGLVAAGLGVSLVPETVSDFRLRGVAYKHLDQAEPVAELAIAWDRATVPATAKRFIEAAG